jgi:hypothetical protein
MNNHNVSLVKKEWKIYASSQIRVSLHADTADISKHIKKM